MLLYFLPLLPALELLKGFLLLFHTAAYPHSVSRLDGNEGRLVQQGVGRISLESLVVKEGKALPLISDLRVETRLWGVRVFPVVKARSMKSLFVRRSKRIESRHWGQQFRSHKFIRLHSAQQMDLRFKPSDTMRGGERSHEKNAPPSTWSSQC